MKLHPEFLTDSERAESEAAAQHLPLELEPDFQQILQDRSTVIPEFYKNSLISIVVETNFFRRGVHVTEKTYKPLSFRHAFVVVATARHLEALHAMGFETFGDFWDEGYDLIEDPRQRMEAVIQVLEGIRGWSREQQTRFRDGVAERLARNQQRLEELVRRNQDLEQFIQRYTV